LFEKDSANDHCKINKERHPPLHD